MKLPKPTFIPALVWLAVITILLCLPGTAFPTENWFSLIWLDKWIHVGLFATLVFLFCFGLTNRKPSGRRFSWRFIAIALACIAYGVIMEFVQDRMIPRRTFDAWDMAANTVGSCLGLIAAFRLLRRNGAA